MIHLGYDLVCNVQKFSKVFSVFEFKLILFNSVKETNKPFIFSLYLQLHLWRSISMSKNGDY